MRRHPLVAALLSAFVPGAGQWYGGDPYRGALFFAPTVLVVTFTYGFATRGKLGMAELLVQPDFLTGLIVANLVILMWRTAAAADAYLVASRGASR